MITAMSSNNHHAQYQYSPFESDQASKILMGLGIAALQTMRILQLTCRSIGDVENSTQNMICFSACVFDKSQIVQFMQRSDEPSLYL